MVPVTKPGSCRWPGPDGPGDQARMDPV